MTNWLDGRIDKNGRVVKPMLSRKQVAALFNVSPQTVSNWMDEGIIEGYFIRSRILFEPEAVECLAQKMKKGEAG